MRTFILNERQAQACFFCLMVSVVPGLAHSDPSHSDKHASPSHSMSAAVNSADVKILPSAKSVKAGDVIYTFSILDSKQKPVKADDLVIEHEKKLHMLVYDPSLNEFQHVHPTFESGQWKVPLVFSINGNYWIWFQGKTKDGADFSVPERVMVSGGKPAHSAPPKLIESRQYSQGPLQVSLGQNEVKAGEETMITMTISRKDKVPLKLSPYLGAFAHVVATPASGDSLIHVHPMNGQKSNEGMIHTKFPSAGSYKLWIQFEESGKVVTAPVVIAVK